MAILAMPAARAGGAVKKSRKTLSNIPRQSRGLSDVGPSKGPDVQETPHPHDVQNVGPPTSSLGHLLPSVVSHFNVDNGWDPLTRPAPAGESAGCGPPSPPRESV